MSMDYKKATGFASIGLVLIGVGLCLLSYFVIPLDLATLRIIVSIVGFYLSTTGALWPVFFSMPDEYGDQIKGIRRFLLLLATIALFGVAVVPFMFSIMDFQIAEHPAIIVALAVMFSHILFGIISLFFINGNKYPLHHQFFDFVPNESLLLALFVGSPVIFPLCLLSWVIGWGHTFFFKSLYLWQIIFFFVCVVCLGLGLFFYFRPMGESEIDKDIKLIGVILFYVAALFPGILQFDDDKIEENEFVWVILTIIPTMIATFVASVFANIAFFEGQQIGIANLISGSYCFGAIVGLSITRYSKSTKSWPKLLKILLSALLAPLWAILAIIVIIVEGSKYKAEGR